MSLPRDERSTPKSRINSPFFDVEGDIPNNRQLIQDENVHTLPSPPQNATIPPLNDSLPPSHNMEHLTPGSQPVQTYRAHSPLQSTHVSDFYHSPVLDRLVPHPSSQILSPDQQEYPNPDTHSTPPSHLNAIVHHNSLNQPIQPTTANGRFTKPLKLQPSQHQLQKQWQRQTPHNYQQPSPTPDGYEQSPEASSERGFQSPPIRRRPRDYNHHYPQLHVPDALPRHDTNGQTTRTVSGDLAYLQTPPEHLHPEPLSFVSPHLHSQLSPPGQDNLLIPSPSVSPPPSVAIMGVPQLPHGYPQPPLSEFPSTPTTSPPPLGAEPPSKYPSIAVPHHGLRGITDPSGQPASISIFEQYQLDGHPSIRPISSSSSSMYTSYAPSLTRSFQIDKDEIQSSLRRKALRETSGVPHQGDASHQYALHPDKPLPEYLEQTLYRFVVNQQQDYHQHCEQFSQLHDKLQIVALYNETQDKKRRVTDQINAIRWKCLEFVDDCDDHDDEKVRMMLKLIKNQSKESSSPGKGGMSPSSRKDQIDRDLLSIQQTWQARGRDKECSDDHVQSKSSQKELQTHKRTKDASAEATLVSPHQHPPTGSAFATSANPSHVQHHVQPTNNMTLQHHRQELTMRRRNKFQKFTSLHHRASIHSRRATQCQAEKQMQEIQQFLPSFPQQATTSRDLGDTQSDVGQSSTAQPSPSMKESSSPSSKPSVLRESRRSHLRRSTLHGAAGNHQAYDELPTDETESARTRFNTAIIQYRLQLRKNAQHYWKSQSTQLRESRRNQRLTAAMAQSDPTTRSIYTLWPIVSNLLEIFNQVTTQLKKQYTSTNPSHRPFNELLTATLKTQHTKLITLSKTSPIPVYSTPFSMKLDHFIKLLRILWFYTHKQHEIKHYQQKIRYIKRQCHRYKQLTSSLFHLRALKVCPLVVFKQSLHTQALLASSDIHGVGVVTSPSDLMIIVNNTLNSFRSRLLRQYQDTSNGVNFYYRYIPASNAMAKSISKQDTVIDGVTDGPFRLSTRQIAQHLSEQAFMPTPTVLQSEVTESLASVTITPQPPDLSKDTIGQLFPSQKPTKAMSTMLGIMSSIVPSLQHKDTGTAAQPTMEDGKAQMAATGSQTGSGTHPTVSPIPSFDPGYAPSMMALCRDLILSPLHHSVYDAATYRSIYLLLYQDWMFVSTALHINVLRPDLIPNYMTRLPSVPYKVDRFTRRKLTNEEIDALLARLSPGDEPSGPHTPLDTFGKEDTGFSPALSTQSQPTPSGIPGMSTTTTATKVFAGPGHNIPSFGRMATDHAGTYMPLGSKQHLNQAFPPASQSCSNTVQPDPLMDSKALANQSYLNSFVDSVLDDPAIHLEFSETSGEVFMTKYTLLDTIEIPEYTLNPRAMYQASAALAKMKNVFIRFGFGFHHLDTFQCVDAVLSNRHYTLLIESIQTTLHIPKYSNELLKTTISELHAQKPGEPLYMRHPHSHLAHLTTPDAVPANAQTKTSSSLTMVDHVTGQPFTSIVNAITMKDIQFVMRMNHSTFRQKFLSLVYNPLYFVQTLHTWYEFSTQDLLVNPNQQFITPYTLTALAKKYMELSLSSGHSSINGNGSHSYKHGHIHHRSPTHGVYSPTTSFAQRSSIKSRSHAVKKQGYVHPPNQAMPLSAGSPMTRPFIDKYKAKENSVFVNHFTRKISFLFYQFNVQDDFETQSQICSEYSSTRSSDGSYLPGGPSLTAHSLSVISQAQMAQHAWKPSMSDNEYKTLHSVFSTELTVNHIQSQYDAALLRYQDAAKRVAHQIKAYHRCELAKEQLEMQRKFYMKFNPRQRSQLPLGQIERDFEDIIKSSTKLFSPVIPRVMKYNLQNYKCIPSTSLMALQHTIQFHVMLRDKTRTAVLQQLDYIGGSRFLSQISEYCDHVIENYQQMIQTFKTKIQNEQNELIFYHIHTYLTQSPPQTVNHKNDSTVSSQSSGADPSKYPLSITAPQAGMSPSPSYQNRQKSQFQLSPSYLSTPSTGTNLVSIQRSPSHHRDVQLPHGTSSGTGTPLAATKSFVFLKGKHNPPYSPPPDALTRSRSKVYDFGFASKSPQDGMPSHLESPSPENTLLSARYDEGGSYYAALSHPGHQFMSTSQQFTHRIFPSLTTMTGDKQHPDPMYQMTLQFPLPRPDTQQLHAIPTHLYILGGTHQESPATIVPTRRDRGYSVASSHAYRSNQPAIWLSGPSSISNRDGTTAAASGTSEEAMDVRPPTYFTTDDYAHQSSEYGDTYSYSDRQPNDPGPYNNSLVDTPGFLPRNLSTVFDNEDSRETMQLNNSGNFNISLPPSQSNIGSVISTTSREIEGNAPFISHINTRQSRSAADGGSVHPHQTSSSTVSGSAKTQQVYLETDPDQHLAGYPSFDMRSSYHRVQSQPTMYRNGPPPEDRNDQTLATAGHKNSTFTDMQSVRSGKWNSQNDDHSRRSSPRSTTPNEGGKRSPSMVSSSPSKAQWGSHLFKTILRRSRPDSTGAHKDGHGDDGYPSPDVTDFAHDRDPTRGGQEPRDAHHFFHRSAEMTPVELFDQIHQHYATFLYENAQYCRDSIDAHHAKLSEYLQRASLCDDDSVITAEFVQPTRFISFLHVNGLLSVSSSRYIHYHRLYFSKRRQHALLKQVFGHSSMQCCDGDPFTQPCRCDVDEISNNFIIDLNKASINREKVQEFLSILRPCVLYMPRYFLSLTQAELQAYIQTEQFRKYALIEKKLQYKHPDIFDYLQNYFSQYRQRIRDFERERTGVSAENSSSGKAGTSNQSVYHEASTQVKSPRKTHYYEFFDASMEDNFSSSSSRPASASSSSSFSSRNNIPAQPAYPHHQQNPHSTRSSDAVSIEQDFSHGFSDEGYATYGNTVNGGHRFSLGSILPHTAPYDRSTHPLTWINSPSKDMNNGAVIVISSNNVPILTLSREHIYAYHIELTGEGYLKQMEMNYRLHLNRKQQYVALSDSNLFRALGSTLDPSKLYLQGFLQKHGDVPRFFTRQDRWVYTPTLTRDRLHQQQLYLSHLTKKAYQLAHASQLQPYSANPALSAPANNKRRKRQQDNENVSLLSIINMLSSTYPLYHNIFLYSMMNSVDDLSFSYRNLPLILSKQNSLPFLFPFSANFLFRDNLAPTISLNPTKTTLLREHAAARIPPLYKLSDYGLSKLNSADRQMLAQKGMLWSLSALPLKSNKPHQQQQPQLTHMSASGNTGTSPGVSVSGVPNISTASSIQETDRDAIQLSSFASWAGSMSFAYRLTESIYGRYLLFFIYIVIAIIVGGSFAFNLSILEPNMVTFPFTVFFICTHYLYLAVILLILRVFERFFERYPRFKSSYRLSFLMYCYGFMRPATRLDYFNYFLYLTNQVNDPSTKITIDDYNRFLLWRSGNPLAMSSSDKASSKKPIPHSTWVEYNKLYGQERPEPRTKRANAPPRPAYYHTSTEDAAVYPSQLDSGGLPPHALRTTLYPGQHQYQPYNYGVQSNTSPASGVTHGGVPSPMVHHHSSVITSGQPQHSSHRHGSAGDIEMVPLSHPPFQDHRIQRQGSANPTIPPPPHPQGGAPSHYPLISHGLPVSPPIPHRPQRKMSCWYRFTNSIWSFTRRHRDIMYFVIASCVLVFATSSSFLCSTRIGLTAFFSSCLCGFVIGNFLSNFFQLFYHNHQQGERTQRQRRYLLEKHEKQISRREHSNRAPHSRIQNELLHDQHQHQPPLYKSSRSRHRRRINPSMFLGFGLCFLSCILMVCYLHYSQPLGIVTIYVLFVVASSSLWTVSASFALQHASRIFSSHLAYLSATAGVAVGISFVVSLFVFFLNNASYTDNFELIYDILKSTHHVVLASRIGFSVFWVGYSLLTYLLDVTYTSNAIYFSALIAATIFDTTEWSTTVSTMNTGQTISTLMFTVLGVLVYCMATNQNDVIYRVQLRKETLNEVERNLDEQLLGSMPVYRYEDKADDLYNYNLRRLRKIHQQQLEQQHLQNLHASLLQLEHEGDDNDDDDKNQRRDPYPFGGLNFSSYPFSPPPPMSGSENGSQYGLQQREPSLNGSQKQHLVKQQLAGPTGSSSAEEVHSSDPTSAMSRFSRRFSTEGGIGTGDNASSIHDDMSPHQFHHHQLHLLKSIGAQRLLGAAPHEIFSTMFQPQYPSHRAPNTGAPGRPLPQQHAGAKAPQYHRQITPTYDRHGSYDTLDTSEHDYAMNNQPAMGTSSKHVHLSSTMPSHHQSSEYQPLYTPPVPSTARQEPSAASDFIPTMSAEHHDPLRSRQFDTTMAIHSQPPEHSNITNKSHLRTPPIHTSSRPEDEQSMALLSPYILDLDKKPTRRPRGLSRARNPSQTRGSESQHSRNFSTTQYIPQRRPPLGEIFADLETSTDVGSNHGYSTHVPPIPPYHHSTRRMPLRSTERSSSRARSTERGHQ